MWLKSGGLFKRWGCLDDNDDFLHHDEVSRRAGNNNIIDDAAFDREFSFRGANHYYHGGHRHRTPPPVAVIAIPASGSDDGGREDAGKSDELYLYSPVDALTFESEIEKTTATATAAEMVVAVRENFVKIQNDSIEITTLPSTVGPSRCGSSRSSSIGTDPRCQSHWNDAIVQESTVASSTIDGKLVLVKHCSLRHYSNQTVYHSESERTWSSNSIQNDEHPDEENEEDPTAADILESGHGGFLLIAFVMIIYWCALVYETLKHQRKTRKNKKTRESPKITSQRRNSRYVSPLSSSSSSSSSTPEPCPGDGDSSVVVGSGKNNYTGRAGRNFSALLQRAEARSSAAAASHRDRRQRTPENRLLPPPPKIQRQLHRPIHELLTTAVSPPPPLQTTTTSDGSSSPPCRDETSHSESGTSGDTTTKDNNSMIRSRTGQNEPVDATDRLLLLAVGRNVRRSKTKEQPAGGDNSCGWSL